MTLTSDEQLMRFNDLGCEYGKLLDQRLGVAEKCIDKQDKLNESFMKIIQNIYIAVIILSCLSGVNATVAVIKFFMP